MKKFSVLIVSVLLCALPAAAFFDDIIKEAVSGAVNEAANQAVKKAKREAVKSIDAELKEVLEQQPVETSPEETEKKLKKLLDNNLSPEIRKIAKTRGSKDVVDKEKNSDKSGNSWSVSNYKCLIIGDDSKCDAADEDCWLENVKSVKQYGDISNTFVGGFDWTPYAARPYTIIILSPESGNTLNASSYKEALEALKQVFPDMKKIPKSVWFAE